MTNTSDLIDSPEATLSKDNSVSEQDQASSMSRLGVVVGSKKVLIQLTDISEVLPVPPLQPVPLTKPWFLGVVNVRGNLHSVTDLAHFLGMPHTVRQIGNRVVLLNSVKTTQAALLVDAVIGLRNIASMKLMTTELDATEAMFSGSVYQDADSTEWHALDVDVLIQDAAFIQPSLS